MNQLKNSFKIKIKTTKMSDSESLDVKYYLENLEYGDEISFDDFKKVSDKFTKEDYFKFLNLEFDDDICDPENPAEELYKILLFIYDKLDMSQEEFQKILEDIIIKYLKKGENFEFSISLLEKIYCQNKFNFDINTFVIPALEGLVKMQNSAGNDGDYYKDFKYSGYLITSFLGIHGANFETDEATIIIKKFDTKNYYYPQFIKNPIEKYTNYYRSCSECCAVKNKKEDE